MLKFRENIDIGGIWTTVVKIMRIFENKIAKMRTCLTKFSRIFEYGAVLPLLEQRARVHLLFNSPGLAALLRSDGFRNSSPGPCVSSGGRLPEALFMIFLSDSKGANVCKIL